jgi:hypothetical protein
MEEAAKQSHGSPTVLLELGRRKIAESRVKPFLVIDPLQKFSDASRGLMEIPVFVAVHLFLL